MAESQAKSTVLVIDDNTDALEVLSHLLEEKGYRPLVASTGAKGLALAQSESPDLIVLDIMMPEMSGFQVCQGLKGNPATEGIPVVVLTARKAERDWSYARTVGAVDYLTKPVRPSQLLNAIRKHLDEGQRAKAGQQIGVAQVLVIAEDAAFIKALSSAIDARNFVRKSRNRFAMAHADGFAQARTAIQEHPPAVIVLDARVRREAADQILRKLKTDKKHKSLPVLVVRHTSTDDFKYTWADARLPARPSGKQIVSAIDGLVER